MAQVVEDPSSKCEPQVQGPVQTKKKKTQKSIKSGKNVIWYLARDGINTHTY
jgi:hypothetical protein